MTHILAFVRNLRTGSVMRTQRPWWSYRGLAIERQGSGEYRYVEGRRRRSPNAVMLRGLNRNHHHDLHVRRSSGPECNRKIAVEESVTGD